MPFARRQLLTVALVSLLAACGGGGGDGRSSEEVAAIPATTATLDAANGGLLEVTQADSPLRGVQVVFPPGALRDAQERVTIASTASLPGEPQEGLLAQGAVPVGPTVAITRSGQGALGDRVLLRLSAPPESLRNLDVMATVWDDSLRRYVPLEVVAVDEVQGHVYAITAHFSLFQLFGVPRRQPVNILTSFKPEQHGFAQPNISSVFDSGDCYGISAFARWHFDHKAESLYHRFGGGDSSFFGDDVAREVMAEAQIRTLTPNGRIYKEALFNTASEAAYEAWIAGLFEVLYPPNSPEPVPPPRSKIESEVFHGRRLMAQLRSDGPQLLVFGSTSYGAHAVLVYQFISNGIGGTFLAYDPNSPYPAAPRAIRWSSSTGFEVFQVEDSRGKHQIDRFWVTAVDSWFDASELAKIDAKHATLKRFDVLTLGNLVLSDGSQACITTSERPDDCDLVVLSVGNANQAAKHLSVWNRSLNNPLVEEEELTNAGLATDVVKLATSANLLQRGVSNALELIVHDASAPPAGASTIEQKGWLNGYRAFTRIGLRPATLTLQGQETAAGYQVQALLDGQPLLPAKGPFEWWRGDQRLEGESGSMLLLKGTVAPGDGLEFRVRQGPQAAHQVTVRLKPSAGFWQGAILVPTTCTSLPDNNQFDWEPPCKVQAPTNPALGISYFWFDDNSDDVVFQMSGNGTYQRVMSLRWRSLSDELEWAIPTRFKAKVLPLSSLQAIEENAMRRARLTVTSRTPTRIAGTYTVTTVSGYFELGVTNCYSYPLKAACVPQWRTIPTTATGSWYAVRVAGRRPIPIMNNQDICYIDDSGAHDAKETDVGFARNYGALVSPGRDGGTETLPNTCVFAKMASPFQTQ